MMDTIQQLRKKGKLKEAWEIASFQYKKNCNNRKTVENLAWVYYDFLKQQTIKNNINGFLKVCSKLEELDLKDDYKFLKEQLSWVFFMMLKQNLKNSTTISYYYIKNIIDFFRQIIGFEKPSLPLSLLLKTILNTNDEKNKLWKLLPWQNNDILRTTDWEPYIVNGKKLMPLAERVFYVFMRSIIADAGNKSSEAIEELTKVLKTIINDENKKRFTFYNYYLAKAYIILKKNDKAHYHAVNFVKKNFTKSWAWGLLASCDKKQENRIAYLTYAITLEKKETFLLNIRKQLLSELIRKQLHTAAKQNLDIIIKTKLKNNWNVPSRLLDLTSSHWYLKPTDQTTLDYVINNYWPIALKSVFNKLVIETAIVVNADKTSKIVTCNGHKLTINTKKTLKKGDFLTVYRNEFQILKFSIINKNNFKKNCFMPFSGKVILKSNYGFVNNIFIPPNIIRLSGITDGQKCKGMAVKTENPENNRIGLKAVILEKSN